MENFSKKVKIFTWGQKNYKKVKILKFFVLKYFKYRKKTIIGAIIIPIILMSIVRAVVKENKIEFFKEGDFKKCIP